MENKRILFGICGSFCNHAAVLEQLTSLCERNDVTAVVSEAVYNNSTRFFKREEFLGKLRNATKHEIIHTIVEAEKVGPSNAYDIMVIAPMTATVAAKMAHGIYDHPVTLSAKAMIRNQKTIVFGIATNDGLGISAPNIFSLICMKHFYVIPFRQDAPFSKAGSIISDWTLLEKTMDQAIDERQIQPILLEAKNI